MSKRIHFCLCALLALSLSACASIPVADDAAPAYTLPPAQMAYVAPIGDATLEYTAEAVAYFPARDGMTLAPVRLTVSCSASRPHAESVLRAALEFTGDGVAAPLFGALRVQLAGANPVEVSRNVATVNLSAAALQLDHRSLYIACQAIANTLTELDAIEYVNVLVADKQVGLDLASTMPTGAFQRTLNLNAGALYEQTLAQRTEAGQGARLTGVATLYHPLGGAPGLMSEARGVSFADQLPATMIRALLVALSESEHAATAALPDLAALLAEEPALTEASDTAQRIAELRFTAAFDDALAQAGLSRTDACAALTYTLCTYLPNLYGIRVSVGENAIDSLPLNDDTTLSFFGGVQRRADYATLLMDESTLYFANERRTALLETHRAMPYYLAYSPRSLLLALAQGPAEGEPGVALLPQGSLRDADILGVSLQEGTLLVNFSAPFSATVSTLEPAQERLLAYAMTNALLVNPAIHRVAYFVSGSQPDTLAGEISWAGYFYRNAGLVGAKETSADEDSAR